MSDALQYLDEQAIECDDFVRLMSNGLPTSIYKEIRAALQPKQVDVEVFKKPTANVTNEQMKTPEYIAGIINGYNVAMDYIASQGVLNTGGIDLDLSKKVRHFLQAVSENKVAKQLTVQVHSDYAETVGSKASALVAEINSQIVPTPPKQEDE